MRHTKYILKNKRNRDCTKCKRFRGLIGKNYFVCEAQMFEDQKEPWCHDIYDRDFLFKGTCTMFVPKEIDQDDILLDNTTMECSIEEDDQSVPDQE